MDEIPEYIDHKKAIKMVAKKYDMDERKVRQIVDRFFWKIQKLVTNQIIFTIPEIGRIEPNELGKEIKSMKIEERRKFQNRENKKFYLLKRYLKKI